MSELGGIFSISEYKISDLTHLAREEGYRGTMYRVHRIHETSDRSRAGVGEQSPP